MSAKLQVLGVGGAFSPEIGNSSIVIWEKSGGKGLLIDCGYTVYPILKEKKLIDRIDKVFITHRHGDHIGSLDTFLYHKRYLNKQKVKFYGVTDHMEYLKSIDPSFEKDYEEYFEEDKAPIQIIPVKHSEGVPSYAFFNFGLLYSGDTSESLLDTPEARDAKVILHEVTFNDAVNVHTQFNSLARAPDDIKRKTWLYHYNLGDDSQFASKVAQHGFRGFLRQGQTLEF